MSEVYFADLRADRTSRNVLNNIQKLLRNVDLGSAASGLGDSALTGNLPPGEDKFRQVVNTDWTAQLKYAEELGPGERAYGLVRVR